MIRLQQVGFLAVVVTTVASQEPNRAQETAVAAVLDDWHRAAAAANEERYFNHFTIDAIMMGTDATEHWTRDEFREWARPHFAKGSAWSFKATERHIRFSKDGSVAWFDELLDTERLGLCRGSGVLVRQRIDWKIAQYNLSVPIPNEAFDRVKQVIDEAKKEATKGKSDD